MAVAITPVPASLSASDVVKAVAHDLAAEYVLVGRNPAMEETVTMFPRPRATIPGTAEAVSTRTARISTSSIRSSSGRSPVGNGFCVVNPALLTRKSMGRVLSRRRSATRSTCSRSDRSAGSTSTSTRYRSRRATATASSRPTSRETRTSPYPSAARRRAKAFPIPEVAPVTSAVGKDPPHRSVDLLSL